MNERLESEAIDTPELRSQFRVSIFGTASDKDLAAMELATSTAKAMVQNGGFRIATGGQEHGTMKAAAAEAHRLAQELGRPDLEPEGTAMARWEPQTYSKIEIANTLLERLKGLIDKSDAFVSLTGGIGTFLETLNVFHAANIEGGIETYKKPVILLDPTLRLTDASRKVEELFGLFKANPELKDLIFAVNTPEQAEVIAEIFYKKKNGINVSEEEEKLLKIHSIIAYLKDEFDEGAGI